MKPIPEPLLDAATSIGDGAPIDWNTLNNTLDPVDPALAREFRVLEQIAQAQRRLLLAASSHEPRRDARWGRLMLRGEIGRGAVGTVYRAWDPRLEREVALKLYADTEQWPGFDRTRILAEGRLLARVRHPNIVLVHGVEEHDHELGLWLELVDGHTLADEVKTGGPLGFREASLVAQDLSSALAAVHAAGLVHRDVKPQNVMRERGGRIVLMDFGVGYDRRAPVERVATGTPLYMAPELFEGSSAAPSTDIYALGVLLFYLVSGTHPVSAGTRAELERMHRERHRTLLRDVRPDLPPMFVEVVGRMCDPDPAKRFATAGQAEHALSEAMAAPIDSSSVHRLSLRVQALGSRRAWRRAAVAVLIAAGVLAGAWSMARAARSRAETATALAEIERLAGAARYFDALRVARGLARDFSSTRAVQRAIEYVTVQVSVDTQPPGTDVYIRDYFDPAAQWERLGTSPLVNVRVPAGWLHWKVEKPGYVPVERGGWSGIVSTSFTLHRSSEQPRGMVFIDTGRQQVGSAPAVTVPSFWIDRFELTNAEYRVFVEAGGYTRRQFWTQAMVENGRQLSWEDAMRRFVDRTGRSGPATWEAGTFPEGDGNYPVRGISWYEAAAYAEFAGKALPTIYHWRRAEGLIDFENVSGASNFGGKGPVAVGANGDIGTMGTYQMPGNVKEWCWNAVGERRYVLGGSWNEPSYMATSTDARSPFDRSDTHGVRLVSYLDAPPASAFQAVETHRREYSHEAPVSADVFAAYRRMYAYDRTPLDAKVEASEETEQWRRERVSFAAAYGRERVIAQLLLPKGAKPPYQVVVWGSGDDAQQLPSSDRAGTPYYFDFLARGGRAVVIPVMSGDFERRAADDTRSGTNSARDRTIQRVKDIARTIDYLETRPDIDRERIAFYGFSRILGLLETAQDPRIKTAIQLSGGLSGVPQPPEIDLVNFAPRVTIPVLMVNGRYDFNRLLDESQKPLFDLLGTPRRDKKHVVLDAGHAPRRSAFMREVLDWLDTYLGPVRVNGT